MDAKDLFLTQHAAVQSVAVGGNPASAAERAFAGLSDEQMRVRPREDLNSLAWLMWHIARAEQMVTVCTGRPGTAVLSGIALFHPAGHLGEAVTVRSAGGFGTGI